MATGTPLAQDFCERLLDRLPNDNMLRGAWAEHVVARFLGRPEFGRAWSYYDLRGNGGRTISVKHSVGPAANFAVAPSRNAWDAEKDVWLPEADEGPRYWCDVYVFAWLPADDSWPPAAVVFDPDRWRFAAIPRALMEERFVSDRTSPQKTAARSTIETIAPFRGGAELKVLIESSPVDRPDDGAV